MQVQLTITLNPLQPTVPVNDRLSVFWMQILISTVAHHECFRFGFSNPVQSVKCRSFSQCEQWRPRQQDFISSQSSNSRICHRYRSDLLVSDSFWKNHCQTVITESATRCQRILWSRYGKSGWNQSNGKAGMLHVLFYRCITKACHCTKQVHSA